MAVKKVKRKVQSRPHGQGRLRRLHSPYSKAAKRGLVIAAVKNEFFSSAAVRYHMNGTPAESGRHAAASMAGVMRSAAHEGLIEHTDRIVRIKDPVTGRQRKQAVWRSLCYSPGTDDDEEDED